MSQNLSAVLRVCELEKEKKISATDDRKGLTIAAFILALCLKEGRGTPIDQEKLKYSIKYFINQIHIYSITSLTVNIINKRFKV